MHEGLVQVFPFKRRHSPILSRLPVEDEVRCDDRASDDGGAINKLLGEIATIWSIGGLLHVLPFKGILEGCP